MEYEKMILLLFSHREDLCLCLPAGSVAQHCCSEWGKSEQMVGTSKGRWDSGGRGNGGTDNEMGKIDQ